MAPKHDLFGTAMTDCRSIGVVHPGGQCISLGLQSYLRNEGMTGPLKPTPVPPSEEVLGSLGTRSNLSPSHQRLNSPLSPIPYVPQTRVLVLVSQPLLVGICQSHESVFPAVSLPFCSPLFVATARAGRSVWRPPGGLAIGWKREEAHRNIKSLLAHGCLCPC